MSLSERERLESLELIRASNRRMAERAKAPLWYHPALGLLVGGLIAAQALPVALLFVAYGVYAVGLLLLVWAYRRKKGMWIPGYRAGRTRWVMIAVVVLTVGAFLWSVRTGRTSGEDWPFYLAGAFIAALVTIGGFAWEKAYRRDLGVDR